MTLPDKIETQFDTNEGYTYNRPESEILDDLVNTVNKLIDYLGQPTSSPEETL